MVRAENGQIVTEEEAKGLTDNKGKLLEWKEDKERPGIMTAEGSEGPSSTYNYTIEKIQPIKVRVSVTKNRKSMKQIVEMKNKLNKTEVDADDIEVQNEYQNRGQISYLRDLNNAPIPEEQREEQEKQSQSSEEKKAREDAKTYAENAPDKKSKKEAEKISKY